MKVEEIIQYSNMSDMGYCLLCSALMSITATSNYIIIMYIYIFFFIRLVNTFLILFQIQLFLIYFNL